MRAHPISPVTEPMQYRAIGVVRGVYVPADPGQPTRGLIRTADGSELEAVVLGRLLTLMRRHLDLELPHLWVVYPRSRDENQLHLQMVGVWEPSTLSPGEPEALEIASSSATITPTETSPDTLADHQASSASSRASSRASNTDTAAADTASADTTSADTLVDTSSGDALAEGDDYFSVRGELIYTRPETGDLVVKVRQQPRADGSRPIPFKLQLRGEVPLEHLRHFVSLDLRRQGQQLCLEACEVVAPLAQRGTRGGKGRRGGGSPGGGAAGERRGSERRAAESDPGRSAAPVRKHGQAVTRPSR